MFLFVIFLFQRLYLIFLSSFNCFINFKAILWTLFLFQLLVK